MAETFRVVGLEAENFKRIRAIDIRPEGDVVVLAGRNAQGKSSVLDAIWAALAGRAGAVEQPIRAGESKARVRIDMGEIVVERIWTPGGSKLEVTSAAGARFPSPQKMLDDLLGKLSFDPLAFAQAKPKDQLAMLAEAIDLDLDAYAAKRKLRYDERTDVNRTIKSLEARLQPLKDSVDPGEAAPLGEILERRKKLERGMSSYQRALEEHQRLTQELERVAAAGREARQVIVDTLGEEQFEAGPSLVARAAEVLDDLDTQIASAEQHTAQRRAWSERQQLVEQLRYAEGESKELTTQIAEIDEQRQAAIQAARLPVEGLQIGEEEILLNGVPFSQASAAEKLRTSVAIAMAANPHIRVIRIVDGSLLDSSNMALIQQMAAERDFQVWVERVDESGTIGIVIEDGEVKTP